jgi:hypothetical protein
MMMTMKERHSLPTVLASHSWEQKLYVTVD